MHHEPARVQTKGKHLVKVDELMSRNVQRCAPSDSMHRAAQIMYERDCGCVTVMGRDGHLHGIVTDRDICLAAYRSEKPLKDIKIEEEMSRDLATCSPHADVLDAEELMRKHHVRRLPVIDEHGTLVGILTLTDIALAALKTEEIRPQEVFRTLAAVAAPGAAHRTRRGGRLAGSR
jgi:CBS domain-containing protein